MSFLLECFATADKLSVLGERKCCCLLLLNDGPGTLSFPANCVTCSLNRPSFSPRRKTVEASSQVPWLRSLQYLDCILFLQPMWSKTVTQVLKLFFTLEFSEFFTCNFFKFGLNTSGLGQSHCRNFSACNIIIIALILISLVK